MINAEGTSDTSFEYGFDGKDGRNDGRQGIFHMKLEVMVRMTLKQLRF